MNKIMLMGRLTREPEIRVTQEKQTTVAKFGLAVNRRSEREKADFFNVTAFGKLAEFCEKYLAKGTKVVLTGRVEFDNYTNKDGVKVSVTQVIAEEIEFAESKQTTQSEGLPLETQNEELPFRF